jgi:hypothetical protein
MSDSFRGAVFETQIAADVHFRSGLLARLGTRRRGASMTHSDGVARWSSDEGFA